MNSGRQSTASPQANRTAGNEVFNRTSAYGETYNYNFFNTWQVAADSGDYYVATNPTPATGLATIANVQTFTDTQPFIVAANTDPTRSMYPVYIKLTTTVAGTNGTSMHAVIRTDTNLTRVSSGGTAITPINPNASSGNTLGAAALTITAGAITANASTSPRLVDHVTCRTVITVVGDQYYFNFGCLENVPGPIINGTNPSVFTYGVPPVVIGPNTNLNLFLFFAAQTVASQFEVTMGFIFR